MSDVRSRLTAIVILTQEEAALMFADANDGRVLDVDILLRAQARMARLHATVAEGLEWLSDDELMREWQARVDVPLQHPPPWPSPKVVD